MNHNPFWSNSNAFSLIICKVHTKRENSGSWKSDLKKLRQATYSAQLQMSWNFTEIFYGIYKNYWKEKVSEGSQDGPTTHQGAPGPPGAARCVLLSPLSSQGPPSGISSSLTWKKSWEDFRDEEPPSRGGTWAGAIVPSGGQIPPGELPSRRGKPSSSSSPSTLPSWGELSSSSSSTAPSHLKP